MTSDQQRLAGQFSQAPDARTLALSTWSWIGYESMRIPYLVLIKIYIFAPYVTKVLIGDPIKGQALLAAYGMFAGLFAALTVPLLGASLDRIGPRRPLIATFILLSVPLLAPLWWARPDHSGLTVHATIIILMILNILFAYSEILHIAMLGMAVGVRRAGKYSGISLGIANLFTVSLLLFLLWGFALPGRVHAFGIPSQPLFGFTHAAHQMERMTGPLVAVLACISLLFLRYTLDAPPSNISHVTAVRSGLKDVFLLIRGLPSQKNLLKFLIARTLYGDGFHTLIIFGGVYATGVMGWHALELLGYAVVKIAFAGLGGVMAGFVNARIGTRRAIILQLVLAVVLLALMLGISPKRLFYFWEFDAAALAPLWTVPIFRTVPDLVFLGVSGLTSAFSVGSAASGRAMVIEVVPPARVGSYFGLFMLSSSTTVWLAPAAISLLTTLFHSQTAGMLPIVFLLATGGFMLLFVEGGDPHDDEKPIRHMGV